MSYSQFEAKIAQVNDLLSKIASLNGDRFVSDPRTPLGENDCVLILSADAGG